VWKSLKTAWFGVRAGAASSIHAHFQVWCRNGVWHKVFQHMLKFYDHHQRIQWRWQALDSKSVPAPLGGQKTGPNPTDRGKYGSKRHVLVDARGAPLAITISAANLHDSQAALTTLRALPLAGPMQNPQRIYRIHHLCADKAYDSQFVRQGAEQMGYRTHIPHRTGTCQKASAAQTSASDVTARKYPARRWVVEPAHAWQNQFRSLRVRWLKVGSRRRPTGLASLSLLRV
jgi:putative transposase